ncbi:MAG: glycosyltransferase family 39 protein, partial [Candidatus Yanofskybacteria bacterium]|nr:glycosyltransferase family 39 protein [Candidatus Yanofskybacteria bacterium]
FGFLNLVLVYQIVKKVTSGAKIALLGAFLYVISVYSAISNLQIDIDGAILPFFVLLTYYAYLRMSEDKGWFWRVIFVLGIAGGLLTKMSFVLFLGTLIIDYLLSSYVSSRLDFKRISLRIIKFWWPLVLAGLVFFYLYASRLDYVIEYARNFNSLNFGSRAYFELGFKVLKSFVWLSPLLLLPVVGGIFNREILRKYRFWYLYLVINLVFYLVLFDFTKLTIERYFMFWIIPSVIISSEIILKLISGFNVRKNYFNLISIGVLFTGISFFTLSVNQAVLPLNPKEEYVRHIQSLDFNFLLPLTGGSGPAGFYFSAQFILWMWLLCGFFLAGALFFKKIRVHLAIIFLVFGLGYNLVFMNEYLFGSLFGSVPAVTRASVDYVRNNPDITNVITYYDIGAYDLRLADKYEARFYTAPSRDYTVRMDAYRGHYMIVDFPAIDKNGRYWPLVARCLLLKKFQDKKVESYIFDCSKI